MESAGSRTVLLVTGGPDVSEFWKVVNALHKPQVHGAVSAPFEGGFLLLRERWTQTRFELHASRSFHFAATSLVPEARPLVTDVRHLPEVEHDGGTSVLSLCDAVVQPPEKAAKTKDHMELTIDSQNWTIGKGFAAGAKTDNSSPTELRSCALDLEELEIPETTSAMRVLDEVRMSLAGGTVRATLLHNSFTMHETKLHNIVLHCTTSSGKHDAPDAVGTCKTKQTENFFGWRHVRL